ncbi:MAG: hypothetical protein I8H75_01250 [Myxococcaceae bacterium]|nr:hypothetical protein [Myxococcaceae bacterium]MBH2005968.1 hypothetical protein [Myxococcaceae bacterium]
MRKFRWMVCFISLATQAQYFNSSAFQLYLGWAGYDTSASFLRPQPDPNEWPMTDQLQLGLGYQYALYQYSLWWFTQSAVSFGYARNYGLSQTQILPAVNALTGLRWNFASQNWRPFVQTGIGLVALFNNPNSSSDSSSPSKQAWMILELGPGLEWVFMNEMSFQIDLGAQAFFDFHHATRFSYAGRFSYLFYF